MNAQQITAKARHIENHFDSGKGNSLRSYLEKEKDVALESKGIPASQYKLFAVRDNGHAGSEIFGPQNVLIGTYSEEMLYGAANSPLPHFRSAIRSLGAKAKNICQFKQGDVEYLYQVTLFWAELNRLTEFLEVSTHVAEIVSELLTARFQFLGKDTPEAAVIALAEALRILTEAKRIDSATVEKVVAALGGGGIDSMAIDALRQDHA